ncbi:MAG: hypothetical protein IT457_04120 [Planctomycetes bacterium]|nr:hypothetical protein [Planctomycetota bacterium]
MKLRAKFERQAVAAPAPKPAAEITESERDATVTPAARNLALAHYLSRMVERGLIADYTQAARMLGVSQPRVTHLMSLLLLSPAIQEEILFGRIAPGDKELRRMARVAEWREQASLRAR